MIRVGTAGWDYPEWRGTFYPARMPRGVDRLSYVARYFDVVEVNSTFYRPAPSRTAEGWVARVERFPDFRFTAKLWRRFTHERTAAWTRAEVQAATAALEPLHEAGRLGALLLQFPWSFRRTEENLAWLGDLVSTFGRFPLVVEIRHESWNVPEFYQSLSESGVGFVNIDQPLFGHSIKPSATATAATGYVRIHGRNYHEWFRKDATSVDRYDYLYTTKELEPWAARVEQIAERTRDTYVVTNNHNLGKAGVNALELKSMLLGHRVDAPPTLVASYPEALAPFARPAE